MSNYRTHTLVNLLVALPLCVAGAALFTKLPTPLIATFVGCLVYGTLFMNPDMDLAHQIKLKSIRGLLSFPFRTYSMVFKHRGLSHSLVFGTLTRLLWVAMYAIAILYIVHKILPIALPLKKWLLHYKHYYAAGFVGFFVADLCHLIMDFLHSHKIKRL